MAVSFRRPLLTPTLLQVAPPPLQQQLLLLLLLLLHTPPGACQPTDQIATQSSSAVVELTLSSAEPALNVLRFQQDIALVCDVNATRVRVVGTPGPDIATGTTTVVIEITAAVDDTERSAIYAMERLLGAVDTMVVSAAGTTVLQFGAQVMQRPGTTGRSVPPAVDQVADSALTVKQISLIASSSFCGAGFIVGVAALTWRHWRKHKQIKVAQF